MKRSASDVFFSNANKWNKEFATLRQVILACGLTEELKWGKPCYTFQNSNIVILQGFKEYCAVLFFKGVLLSDPDNMLIKTGKNTIVGRQVRFTDVEEINELAIILKSYIKEAIEMEKAGVKINATEITLLYPDEFKKKLTEDSAFKNAFEALTPGRQRAYNIFFFCTQTI